MTEEHIEYFLKTEEELEEQKAKDEELLKFLDKIDWSNISFASNIIVENMDLYRIPDSIYANRDMFNNIYWDFEKSTKKHLANGYRFGGVEMRFIPPQFVNFLCIPFKADGSHVRVDCKMTLVSTRAMLACISHFYAVNINKLEPGLLENHIFKRFDVKLPENEWTMVLAKTKTQ